MPWTTLHLKITTPMFCAGGGDQQDSSVRVPSLRGAMRFWFRALAGTVAGHNLTTLAAMEEAVFGSTRVPSRISMRIGAQPKVVTDPKPAFVTEPKRGGGHRPPAGTRQPRDDGKWLLYLLGQGLADAGTRELRRHFIDAGKDVKIDFRFSGDESADTLALASLWLLCAYGGLGSRTRRGFGGLAITGCEGKLPDYWTPESVLTPGLDYFSRQTRLWPAEHMEMWQYYLADLLRDADVDVPAGGEAWTSRPSYPVLSQRWTRAELWSGRPEADWKKVLGYAGEQYRWFRAQRDTPGVNYQPQIKTPEWLMITDPDGGDEFGLGALGLPIVFKKQGATVHADQRTGGTPVKLRRASPLWLRVVGHENQWKLFSFAFQSKFLPEDVDVHFWRDSRRPDRELTVTNDDLDERTNAWLDAVRSRDSWVRNQLR